MTNNQDDRLVALLIVAFLGYILWFFFNNWRAQNPKAFRIQPRHGRYWIQFYSCGWWSDYPGDEYYEVFDTLGQAEDGYRKILERIKEQQEFKKIPTKYL
jgi:hypothetical protein